MENVMARLVNIISAVLYIVAVTKRTRSFIFARLYWLDCRTPRRVPGTFRFPFGPVRYVDAKSLLVMYSEIFVDHSYDVIRLGDAPYIIDCGGNIGLSVIWFKQRYPRATITVFEADPSIAHVLDCNIRNLGLGSVEVVRAAVSDMSGPVPFMPEGTLSGRLAHGTDMMVDSIRLSDYICRPVDLLKLDIEGSEFGVIRDLRSTGKIRLLQNIICEIHSDSTTETHIGQLWSDLSEAGFRITVNRTAFDYPEPNDPTPFTKVPRAEFILLIYAWRP
jgi:FkbM family methyltransferase